MAEALVSVTKTSIEIQQRKMRALEQENAQLKKGVPGDNSALAARNLALEAELAAVKAALAARPVTQEKKKIWVGQKGGICVAVGGSYPFTQYCEQMLKLLDLEPAIRAFMAEHQGELKEKPEKE
jgi:hypothetical protein